jgi:hypothetical protein
MPTISAAINELSFGTVETATDAELLERLARTLLALRRTVAVHDRHRVAFFGPSNLGSLALPGGSKFMAALQLLLRSDELLGQQLLVLLDGPWFDVSENALWQVDGAAAHALSFAFSQPGGLAVSLDASPWQRSRLPMKATGRRARNASVLNAWQPELAAEHRSFMDAQLPVLPDYENPGTHDPTSSKYVQGKAHLPENADRLLEHAVPTGRTLATWWAYCEHGFYHRFSGSRVRQRLRVHWNATTNPDATQVTRVEHVPGVVKARLALLVPTTDCECREVND